MELLLAYRVDLRICQGDLAASERDKARISEALKVPWYKTHDAGVAKGAALVIVAAVVVKWVAK